MTQHKVEEVTARLLQRLGSRHGAIQTTVQEDGSVVVLGRGVYKYQSVHLLLLNNVPDIYKQDLSVSMVCPKCRAAEFTTVGAFVKESRIKPHRKMHVPGLHVVSKDDPDRCPGSGMDGWIEPL